MVKKTQGCQLETLRSYRVTCYTIFVPKMHRKQEAVAALPRSLPIQSFDAAKSVAARQMHRSLFHDVPVR